MSSGFFTLVLGVTVNGQGGVDTMEGWIEAKTAGRAFRITYAQLNANGMGISRILHQLYEERATLDCMCRHIPVPMHIRRIRVHPPSYCLVTNPGHDHARTCPRHHLHIKDEGSGSGRDHSHTTQNSRGTSNRSTDITTGRGFILPGIDQLNEAQQSAATHKDGPCLVVAAAGSGKTAMLIARIKFLVESGVQPERIVACTFTAKAVGEMKARLKTVLGNTARRVTIATMHSLARRMIWSYFGDEWDLREEPSWLMEQVLKDPTDSNPHGVGKLMTPEDAMSAIRRAKTNGLRADQLRNPEARVYAAYQAAMRDHHILDFEDLLLEAIGRFQWDESFQKEWRERWDYVLVDEFQDTNPLQWQFLLELTKVKHNLFTVGDDWQCIYQFRYSKPELMKEFIRVFPQAKQVFLTINYRSNDAIVDLGNDVIQLNEGYQIPKRVQASRPTSDNAIIQTVVAENEADEANGVAEEIQRLHSLMPNIPYRDYAILYRTNVQSRLYAETLSDRNIPHHIVGDKHFYESGDIKVVLDYLRAAAGHDPKVWFRSVINRPRRFIKREEITQLEGAGWEAITVTPKCQGLVDTIHGLQRFTLPADAIRWLVTTTKDLVRQPKEDEPIKWIEALINSASRHKSIAEFLQYVDWVLQNSKEKPQRDAVQLMTIHQSKGLEFQTVFVVGMAEGLLPHKNASDPSSLREETRLCYVAITRAKENLYLSRAKRYGDQELPPSIYFETLQKNWFDEE